MPTIDPELCSGDTILTSARLCLRRPVGGDAETIASLAGDPEVSRFTARIPHPYTVGDAEAFLVTADDGWNDGRERIFLITLREQGTALGMIGLILGDEAGCAEIGFFLSREYWGRGFIVEAVGAVLRYGFENLALDRIRASVVPENSRSLRALEKAGLVFVGREMEEAPARGRCWEVMVGEIARPDCRP
ncbi:MAG: GNAT family N-acetyltransferase [Alphaproteobacteria bacterium]|nr:GNAT family N-acetyltransferase [Alphaproteobacteria bacterium]